MNNLINKYNTIAAITDENIINHLDSIYDSQLHRVKRAVIRIIAQMPTQPERLQRKWNVYYHGFDDFSYSCNYCGYSAPYQKIGGKFIQKKWHYCPNCGVKIVNAEE